LEPVLLMTALVLVALVPVVLALVLVHTALSFLKHNSGKHICDMKTHKKTICTAPFSTSSSETPSESILVRMVACGSPIILSF
jgi:hypothetical protein